MHSRRGVLVGGQIFLIASQILLMEAPTFWVMCIGRLLQGLASAVIIVAGFALMYDKQFLSKTPVDDILRCDATAHKDVGSKYYLTIWEYEMQARVSCRTVRNGHGRTPNRVRLSQKLW